MHHVAGRQVSNIRGLRDSSAFVNKALSVGLLNFCSAEYFPHFLFVSRLGPREQSKFLHSNLLFGRPAILMNLRGRLDVIVDPFGGT